MRMRFTLCAASELLDEASACMAQAKQGHYELEKYYIESADFGKIDEICRGITETMISGS